MTKNGIKRAIKELYSKEYNYNKDKNIFGYGFEAKVDGYKLIGYFMPSRFRLNSKGELMWVEIKYKDFEEKILKRRLGVHDNIIFSFIIGDFCKKKEWTLKLTYNNKNESLFFEPVIYTKSSMLTEEKFEFVNQLIHRYQNYSPWDKGWEEFSQAELRELIGYELKGSFVNPINWGDIVSIIFKHPSMATKDFVKEACINWYNQCLNKKDLENIRKECERVYGYDFFP